MFGSAAYAQSSDNTLWRSTSPMMQSGSNYSSPIAPVGADNITYTDAAGAPSRISGRRNIDDDFITPTDGNVDNESPIGTPYILLLFAIASCTATYLSRHTA